jgi:hypothetical protein
VSHKFIREFEKVTREYGGTDCRDIAGMDWLNREMVKGFYSNPESRKKICVRLAGDTVFIPGKAARSQGEVK